MPTSENTSKTEAPKPGGRPSAQQQRGDNHLPPPRQAAGQQDERRGDKGPDSRQRE
jgi:hypothetical protein